MRKIRSVLEWLWQQKGVSEVERYRHFILKLQQLLKGNFSKQEHKTALAIPVRCQRGDSQKKGKKRCTINLYITETFAVPKSSDGNLTKKSMNYFYCTITW